MKIFFNSLGCDKTLSDSEHIIGNLIAAGCKITDDIKEAELIAINTCCFIGDALEESINAVLLAHQEKSGHAKIAVFGCMAKRFYNNIKESIPEVDYIIPNTEIEDITQALSDIIVCDNKTGRRFLSGQSYYSYLKIAEGCDKHCTYCVIPKIRGAYKSIPMEKLLDEANYLADSGVKELMIVAQETTLYGVDLYGKKMLHILLEKLSEIDGILWIRLLYAYPEEIYDELIYTIRDNKKILNYLDMPIQHCNDNILKLMARRTNKKDIKNVISKLRTNIPDICLRTTIICGFPGETDNNHKELLSFIEDIKFDRLGAFAYSREENTPAFDFSNQVEEDTKIKRQEEVMKLQENLVFEDAKSLLGKNLTCIVEGYIPDEDVWQARSYKDAPDIDGLVFFKSDYEYISGDIVDIKITETFGYDLIGEIYELTK